MPTRRLLALLAAIAVALAALAFQPTAAQAHGSSQQPASRTYMCRFVHPEDPMCATARNANPQALYDWMEVNIGDAAGRHRELIPDGRLCSANRDKYAAFDTPSDTWRATRLQPDADGKYTFTWESSAPHATAYYRLFLTKPGFDPRKPLSWSDLELVHDTGSRPAEATTTIRTVLPDRSGRHILYTIWQRSDSPEAFYSCADVSFSSDVQPDPTATTTAAPTSSASPTSSSSATPTASASPSASPAPGGSAAVSYAITSDWGAGYCMDATVSTESTAPVVWSVPMTATGTVTSIWNGTLKDGMVSGEFWNPTVVKGSTTSFGLCVNRPQAASPTPRPTTTPSATATATPTATAPSSPAATPTASPTASASPTPSGSTSSPTAVAAMTVTSDWGSGYCADIRVSTTSTVPLTWNVPFTYPGTLQSMWNAKVTTDGRRATGETWNAKVTATTPTTFGFCASGTAPKPTPSPTATPPAPSPTPSTPTVAPTATPPVTATPSPTSSPPATATASPTPTATASPTATPGPTTPSSGVRRVGYFTSWGIYQRNYLVKQMDTSGSAAKLTHINYAFGNINTDGECYIVNQSGEGDAWADYGRAFTAQESVDSAADRWDQPLRGNFNQLKELKAKYPKLRTLISLGGWTWSKRFSDVALTQASREKFVRSCVDLYLRGNLPVFDGAGGPGSGAGVFDGIDVDWEYPGSEGLPGNTYRPEDTRNYTLLLQEFRRQMDALSATTGTYYELTAAVPAAPAKIAKYEVSQVARTLDFINVMTYDFRGAWDARGPTNFHSNLYPDPGSPGTAEIKAWSVQTAIDSWRNGGAPAQKLVVGVPFYGRGWTNVTGGGTGLYQPAGAAAPGTYEAGFEDYKVLSTAPGFTKHRDPVTKQMWIFNGTTFWSFDDAQVMADKAAYIKANNLGGAMIWSMDGDTAGGELMTALDTGLR